MVIFNIFDFEKDKAMHKKRGVFVVELALKKNGIVNGQRLGVSKSTILKKKITFSKIL